MRLLFSLFDLVFLLLQEFIELLPQTAIGVNHLSGLF